MDAAEATGEQPPAVSITHLFKLLVSILSGVGNGSVYNCLILPSILFPLFLSCFPIFRVGHTGARIAVGKAIAFTATQRYKLFGKQSLGEIK